jgi:hypothetical protein
MQNVASRCADGDITTCNSVLVLFANGLKLLNSSVSWVHNPYRSAPGATLCL